MVNKGMYKKLFYKETKMGKYKVKEMNFGGGMDEFNVTIARLSCSHWPIKQFSVPKAHWACFMDRFLAENHHDTIAGNTSVRYDEPNCTQGNLVNNTETVKAGRSRRMKAGGSFVLGREPLLSGRLGITHDDFRFAVLKYGMNGVFPFKRAVAAETKQNVYFDDVIYSLKDSDPVYHKYVYDRLHLIVGVTNDQACTMIMSHFALYCHGMQHDLLHWVSWLVNSDACKAISDLTKIMGVANAPYLTLYTEADSLLGRGSVLADETKELDELSGINVPEGHDVRFDKGLVFDMAIKLFNDAMPLVASLPHSGRWHRFLGNTDDYWQERHVNCVNGAHHLPPDKEKFEYVGSKTRMQYLENEQYSPLFNTEPVIFATLSWKFENPKVRAIKSEDTYSYLNEDFIMKAVEEQWRHSEVLLSPSLGSKFKEGERLNKMPGKVYVMLDYSAMDKQHSLNTQVELIDALCHFLGAPDHVREWFRKANTNQFLRSGDRVIKLAYSLLTGRRMTTFINTCLNKIYFDIACKGIKPRSAYFAGDDIVVRMDDDKSAHNVLKAALASKSVFNPRKQSWGEACEFLRVATRDNITLCYSNRIIASAVCGNWVNKMKLAETHLPGIYSRLAWMLDNRSMLNGFASAVLGRSVWKRMGYSLGFCRGLLQHNVSVDDGPVSPRSSTITVVTPRTSVTTTDVKHRLANHASTDYVMKFVSSHEQSVMDGEDIKSLIRTFTRASYLKSLTNGYEVELTNVHTRLVYRSEVICNAQHLESVNSGVLSTHPTLPALRGQLTMTQMSQMVRLITGGSKEGSMTDSEWLFGDRPRCAAAPLGNDFDDVAQLCKAPVFRLQSVTPRVNLPRTCFT